MIARLLLIVLAVALLLGGGAAIERPAEPALRYAVHTVRIHDRPMRLVAEAGFGWVVQLLAWREIEPSPGELYWEYPDTILRAAEHYGVQVVLRLDHQPEWARPGRTNAPPRDPALYPAFVSRVAERYRGRVAGYIIWNEPNLAHEWGGEPPDPEAYARLLGDAAAAVRRADPKALVIAAGLAPTNERSARALDDREFLRRQLAAPGGREFDVLAAHGYGFGLPPDAPAEANGGLNVRRVEQQRAILVEAGLGNRPIWITELGWTVDPTSPVGGPAVSEELRGRYLAAAYALAAREWPWVGLVAVWSLGADEPDDDNQAGFRLAGPGYVPKPSWETLRAMPKGPPPQPVRSKACPAALQWVPAGCRILGLERRPIEILAADVPIHLGDQPDLASPWRPLHGFGRLAPQWRSEFYVDDTTAAWDLTLEALQPNDRGNHLLINGHLLDPPYWPGRDWDYASYWTRLRFRVPDGVLRPGLNVLEVRVGQWVPAFQVWNNRWEDVQFRNIRLVPAGG
ncbi:MAG: hypothetical protein KatS3mg060_0678 [Dehalococcoidia bacterium]|nr:MAG: hypothetical protein KatS3mg060_0678 [Dehalococcoidia bacterium]